MDKREDEKIDWGALNEHNFAVDAEIERTTQNILILSQTISQLNEDTENERKVPRKEDLMKALADVLDIEYKLLDEQNKVKAIRDLNLKTYQPRTRAPRLPAMEDMDSEMNELIKKMLGRPNDYRK